MNLKKCRKDQADGKISFCLILFLFILCCMVRVIYVAAADINEENRESREEAVPAVLSGTSPSDKKLQEQKRIRMANEDGIQTAKFINRGYDLTEKEYGILTRIVEAEAGNMDRKSKILVANVILNRMEHEDFPDTIEEVVFQNVKGAVQFSPVADGRYYTVEVTESTRESVDRALAGEDYSEGALYFMERSMSAASNVNWFDRYLTRLFKYQHHEFFK